uniref:Protein C10 n=1 Tax=Plectus sambesii TaxID=2011161 RepID=A0A914WN20_9BILA
MLSAIEARAVLLEILNGIRRAEKSREMMDAVQLSENDMLRRMQLVYPLLCKIQMDTIANYGFSADAVGVAKFAQQIAGLEKEDGDVKRLNEELRLIFMPALPPAQTERRTNA